MVHLLIDKTPQCQRYIEYELLPITNIWRFVSKLKILVPSLKQKIIKQDNVVALANPMSILFTEFSKEAITDGFNSGKEFANTFINTYVKDYSADKFKQIMPDDINPFEKLYYS